MEEVVPEEQEVRAFSPDRGRLFAHAALFKETPSGLCSDNDLSPPEKLGKKPGIVPRGHGPRLAPAPSG
jgi:hypothetical protein